MDKVKVSELRGDSLDWAVAKCEGYGRDVWRNFRNECRYSTDWAQGGKIIEREVISINANGTTTEPWVATMPDGIVSQCFIVDPTKGTGDSPLIAAMRCYVAYKLGNTVKIPDALLEVA